jgi:hypothetical protein
VTIQPEADATTEVDCSLMTNVDRDMRTPGIASTIEEQEIERLICISHDRMLAIVPQIA